MPPANARRLSLDEVLAAGTEALDDVFGGLAGRAVDYEALEAAIDATKSTLGSGLDGIDRVGADPVAHEQEGGDGINLTELCKALGEVEAGPRMAQLELPTVHPLEEASILLHELLFRASEISASLVRRVDVVLAEVDQASRRDFVQGVIADAIEIVPFERLDAVLPRIAPVVRRSLYPLSDAYAEIATRATPQGLEALWPHAIDEHLLSIRGRRTRLDEAFSQVDDVTLDRAVLRLTQLPAIAERRVTEESFEIDQPFFRRLFARMMATEAHAVIGPIVMTAFHRSPPADDGVRCLVYAVRQYYESLAGILQEQLENPRGLVSSSSQELITEMLIHVLTDLPPKQMSEIWVIHALQWLGAHDWSEATLKQHERTGEFLRGVLSKRRGLGRHWNADCRTAAKLALRSGGWGE
ncbi:MAG: hypothetical protein AAF957_21425 [Planctomycetota bacterium]